MFIVRLTHPTAPEAVFLGNKADFHRLVEQYKQGEKLQLKEYVRCRIDDGGRYIYELPKGEIVIHKKGFLVWKGTAYKPLMRVTAIRGAGQLNQWFQTLQQQNRL